MSEEALQTAEKRREVKGNVKKERLYPFEFRVPKNSKEMGKPSSVISPKTQRETIEWDRL